MCGGMKSRGRWGKSEGRVRGVRVGESEGGGRERVRGEGGRE